MNLQHVIAEMDRMAAQPGIFGCALVDAASGRVWHACAPSCTGGRPAWPEGPVWKEVVDRWRRQERHQLHITGLGTRAEAVMYHAHGVLAVFPCANDPDVLLVAHGRHRGVDWLAWQCMVRTLGRLLHRPGSSRVVRSVVQSTPSPAGQSMLMTSPARSG